MAAEQKAHEDGERAAARKWLDERLSVQDRDGTPGTGMARAVGNPASNPTVNTPICYNFVGKDQAVPISGHLDVGLKPSESEKKPQNNL